jgi:hypothetical protein
MYIHVYALIVKCDDPFEVMEHQFIWFRFWNIGQEYVPNAARLGNINVPVSSRTMEKIDIEDSGNIGVENWTLHR